MKRRPVYGSILAASCLVASGAWAQSPPTTRRATPAPAEEGTPVRISIPGELQLRYTAQTDIPLATTPGRTGQANTLGQNLYTEAWLRLGPRLSVGERFRVITQFDVARLVVPDNPAAGVDLAREPRGELFPYGVFDFRWAYLEWDSPIGVIRAGQQGFSAGLGILANDGTRTPLFGDYRQGDLVERALIATRPGGRTSNIVLALAADLVYRDRLVQLVNGDIALQGVASLFYQHHACRTDCEKKRVGGFVTVRDVSFNTGDALRVVAADVFARWEWPQPDHVGRVFAGFEFAAVYGTTDAPRTQYFPEHRVIQFGGAGELGLERDGRYRIALEGGYASGDRNPVDGDQRRFNFNPSHRVGLILFPEVIAWETARSATIASDPALAGRPARGAYLLPSQGGVTGAAYLYPNVRVNLSRHIDLRAAAVIGIATTDWVDPTSVQIYGTARNYRGGDPTRRDLGIELDLGLNAVFPIPGAVTVTGGVQGGVLFPGHAFDDAMGRSMSRVGLLNARLGLMF